MIKNLFLKINSYLPKNKYMFILVLYMLIVFGSMVKINFFRYENFDMGKFDLGNMTQMSWYTLRGQFMYLTDYFGSNVPRWSMSHVDPILVVFIPLFFIFPHPLTLVFAQNLLIILASLFIYKISELKTKNKLFSLFISLAYLTYPALGFLLSWTGYHGVSPAIFFFLWFFYLVFKYEDEKRILGVVDYLKLFLLLIVTLSGKEQISLYFVLLGIYIVLKTAYKKFGIFVSVFSLVWFLTCFFVIIPNYAHYRIESFEKFTSELGLSKEEIPNVYSSNYFLARYSEFGTSYSEIIKNMALNPVKTASVFLSGDKIDNLYLTFGPLMYLSLLSPLILFIAFPDLLINYSTSQGGIGTSEIYNHRISMIIPVLFLSVIFGVSFLIRFLNHYFDKKYSNYVASILGVLIFANCFYFSNNVSEKNPIFSWIISAIDKRVFAKSDTSVLKKSMKVGDIVRVDPLENNDRECVRKILDRIPPKVSVSGPDFMGSHLAQRETYAIFPAGKSTSDYLIVDIFSQKLLKILELDVELNRNFVSDTLRDPNYDLEFNCANLLVFKKHDLPIVENLNQLAPFQIYKNYSKKVNYPIFNDLNLVDFSYEKDIKINSTSKVSYVFTKESSKSLSGFVSFTTLVNKETGNIFQFANYPSYAFSTLNSWEEGKFYSEEIKFVVPSYLEAGAYYLFVGVDNKINSRSVYLGDINLK